MFFYDILKKGGIEVFTSNNIILVSLVDSQLEEIGKSLAQKLDFFYLNMEALIDYELCDKEKMLDVCGIDYMSKKEAKVVRDVNYYEKTVITMTYNTFSNNITSILSKNKIIYLKVTKAQLRKEIEKIEDTKIINVKEEQTEKLNDNNGNIEDKMILLTKLNIADLVFNERDKFLNINCNLTVKYDILNVDKTVGRIYQTIIDNKIVE